MSLEDLRRNWNGLAQGDAFDAVLTGGVHGARDVEAFLRTGVEEIEAMMARVRAAGLTPASGRALDFGCGLGRLTQALARHFERADGVDIAPSMLEQARALNRLGDRCHFHLNDRDDLGLFSDGTFDLVYSNITLQHMEPRYSRRYVEEFFRVTRQGGVVVFQVPGEPTKPPGRHTRSVAPLPRTGYRAQFERLAPIRCAPGAVLSLQVIVRNTGSSLWPAEGNPDGTYSIRMGNHWRSRWGRMLRFNDCRAKLPHDIAPGEAAEMLMRVEAPGTPGTYTLEFDMVQEHVQWFVTAGSKTTRVRVRVDPRMPPGDAEGLAPRMEMYGLPPPEVEALVARAGGVLRAVHENDATGPGWTSYLYICAR